MNPRARLMHMGSEDATLAVVHEAAHAVFNHRLLGIRVKWIGPDSQGMFTKTEPLEMRPDISDELAVHWLASILAGPMAEVGIMDGPEKVKHLADLPQLTGDDEDISRLAALLIHGGRVQDWKDFCERYLDPAGHKASECLDTWWDTIWTVAGELYRYGRLSGWEFRRLVDEAAPR